MTLSNIWNDRSLRAPPVCFMQVGLESEDSEKLHKIFSVLSDVVGELSDQSLFASELFILSKLIYKFNLQFRPLRTVCVLKKVERCLRRIVDVNLLAEVQILSTSTDEQTAQFSAQNVYFPSRQMLEHLLVRMIGVSTLALQAASFCIDSYKYVGGYLSLGHFVSINMTLLAIISRIWSLCSSMCLDIAMWYTNLLPFLDILPQTQVEWLPAGDALPLELIPWIHEKLDIEEREFTRCGEDKLEKYLEKFNKTSSMDQDLDSSEKEPVSKTNEFVPINTSTCEEDIGVAVSPMRQHDSPMDTSHKDLIEDMYTSIIKKDVKDSDLFQHSKACIQDLMSNLDMCKNCNDVELVRRHFQHAFYSSITRKRCLKMFGSVRSMYKKKFLCKSNGKPWPDHFETLKNIIRKCILELEDTGKLMCNDINCMKKIYNENRQKMRLSFKRKKDKCLYGHVDGCQNVVVDVGQIYMEHSKTNEQEKLQDSSSTCRTSPTDKIFDELSRKRTFGGDSNPNFAKRRKLHDSTCDETRKTERVSKEKKRNRRKQKTIAIRKKKEKLMHDVQETDVMKKSNGKKKTNLMQKKLLDFDSGLDVSHCTPNYVIDNRKVRTKTKLENYSAQDEIRKTEQALKLKKRNRRIAKKKMKEKLKHDDREKDVKKTEIVKKEKKLRQKKLHDFDSVVDVSQCTPDYVIDKRKVNKKTKLEKKKLKKERKSLQESKK